MHRHVIVTGPPGVGKTTLIRRVSELLQKDGKIPFSGFYTEEIRSGPGERTGFQVIDCVTNARGKLASVEPGSGTRKPKVGKYSVFVDDFEAVALPCLENKEARLVIIDEIGKMELFSRRFSGEIERLLRRSDLALLATVPVAKGTPLPLVENILALPTVQLFTLNRGNRESMVSVVYESVLKACQ